MALARPASVITLASQRGTLIMAMDVSGSMRAADVHPTRITAAQRAAKAFVKERPRQVKIGLVAFSGGAFLVQAPTDNNVDLDTAIDNLQPERMTAIGSAVLTSLQTIFPDVRFDQMLPGFGGSEFYLGTPLENSRRAKPPKPKRHPGRAGQLSFRRDHPDDRRQEHHGSRSGRGGAHRGQLRRARLHHRLRHRQRPDSCSATA